MSIEAIKAALADGPTEGPWVSDDNEGHSPLKIWAGCAPSGHSETPGTMVAIIYETARECEENAAFIAACNPVAIRSLIERLEAAEKDAERYAWLKLNSPHSAVYLEINGEIQDDRTLDAAIDSAMAGGLAEGVSDADAALLLLPYAGKSWGVLAYAGLYRGAQDGTTKHNKKQ